MKCTIAAIKSSVLFIEGSIHRVIEGSQVPKDRELLHASLFDLSVVDDEIVDDDFREYRWKQSVKCLKQRNDLLMVFLLVKQVPQCLNDVRAVMIPGVLQGFIYRAAAAPSHQVSSCFSHDQVLQLLDRVVRTFAIF